MTDTVLRPVPARPRDGAPAAPDAPAPAAPATIATRATGGAAAPRRPAAAGEPLWRQVLGDRLRRQRHHRGETLDETAARAGVSPQYLSEIERGLKDPSSEMIAAVSGALDLTLVDLTVSVAEVLGASPAPSRPASAAPSAVELALRDAYGGVLMLAA